MLHGKQALKTFLFNPQIPKIPTNGQGYVPLVMVFVSRTVTNTNSRPGSGLSTCARCATSVDMNLLLLQEWTRWSWRLATCASCATSVDADDAAVAGVDQVISVTGYFCKLCHKFYNNEMMARITHCKTQAHFDKYLVRVSLLCSSLLCRTITAVIQKNCLESDWLIELWFYVPLDTKHIISETFPHAVLLAWYGRN